MANTDDTTHMVESEEELKSLLMKVKEKSEKAGLKLNTEKTKIMASGPITSWQIVGGKAETVTDCVFLGSRITVDGDCRYKIKTFASWKESYDRPRQRIKRDITLPTKVRLVKVMVFPVVRYGCESWTLKKAEHQRIDTFNCGVGEDS